MNALVEIRLWGSTIGALSLAEGEETAAFQYEPGFADSGVEVSPVSMPLSRAVYRFPELAYASFRGLPGLLADSLPDRFGQALINAWLAAQGRTPASFNALERLCYVGDRGMGALEYLPATGPQRRRSTQLQVDELLDLAAQILSRREELQVSFADDSRAQSMFDILQVGTSAGGQRPKAVIAWNPHSNEVRCGQLQTEKGFEYWILKFDGVSGTQDRALESPLGYGLIEYAYAQMAQSAGIEMSESRLFVENDRQHFMTRRFDRLEGGEKLHMQSLSAMAHYDYRLAGAYSYEQALLVMRQLQLPMADIEQQYRRMVFNILARNQDDHVKNIAFLMNKSGQWSLSPAFDITWSYNPQGEWTAQHQMTVNGKRDHFNFDDLKACALSASLKRGRAEKIISEVKAAVVQWPQFASAAGVSKKLSDVIARSLRHKDF